MPNRINRAELRKVRARGDAYHLPSPYLGRIKSKIHVLSGIVGEFSKC